MQSGGSFEGVLGVGFGVAPRRAHIMPTGKTRKVFCSMLMYTPAPWMCLEVNAPLPSKLSVNKRQN